MTITRRDVLKTGAAALLLPTWLLKRQTVRHIDLSLFCDPESAECRYDMTRPFHQDGVTFATDARICVRTTLPVNMDGADERSQPKFDSLKWEPDGKGWLPLSRANRIPSELFRGHPIEYECPSCFGKGRGGNYRPCPKCDATGWMVIRCSDDFENYETPCTCRTGYLGGTECHECSGKGQVTYRYQLGGLMLAPTYVEKMQTLGDVDCLPRPDDIQALFRFDGGEGIVMGLAR